MNNNYLIPANSKKSMLILGFFTWFDIVVFSIGATFTLAMLFIFESKTLTQMLLILTPAFVTAFMVMPVPYYHNVMTLIGNIYRFYAQRRNYYWKGWCVCDDPERRSSRRKNFE